MISRRRRRELTAAPEPRPRVPRAACDSPRDETEPQLDRARACVAQGKARDFVGRMPPYARLESDADRDEEAEMRRLEDGGVSPTPQAQSPHSTSSHPACPSTPILALQLGSFSS